MFAGIRKKVGYVDETKVGHVTHFKSQDRLGYTLLTSSHLFCEDKRTSLVSSHLLRLSTMQLSQWAVDDSWLTLLHFHFLHHMLSFGDGS